MYYLQDTPPDTSGYMIAGYAIFFIVMAVYLVSLWLRWRNLNRDLETLETVLTEKQSAAKAPAAPRKKAGKKSPAKSAARKKR